MTKALDFSLAADALPYVAFGQCRFTYVSTSLCRLVRFNGRYLMINGRFELIPTGGVDIAPGALAANDTNYYIYAYMSSGSMTLEASTTAPADGARGNRIKSGDESRSLVGMARKVSGEFRSTATQRFVRTWFNDPGVAGELDLGSDTYVGFSPWGQISSGFLVAFLAWAGEMINARLDTTTRDTGATGGIIYSGLGFNSTSAVTGNTYVNPPAVGYWSAQSCSFSRPSTSDGYNYVAGLGGVSGGGTPIYGAASRLAVLTGGSGA